MKISENAAASCCSNEPATVSDPGNALVGATERRDDHLGRDILLYVRSLLSDRRVLIGLTAAIVVAGAALNWGWLVAVGAAPLLLSLAPCAAMCALGVCAMCKSGKSCDQSGAREQGSKQVGLAATDQARRREPEAGGQ